MEFQGLPWCLHWAGCSEGMCGLWRAPMAQPCRVEGYKKKKGNHLRCLPALELSPELFKVTLGVNTGTEKNQFLYFPSQFLTFSPTCFRGQSVWLQLDHRVLDHDLPKKPGPATLYFAVRWVIVSTKQTRPLGFICHQRILFKRTDYRFDKGNKSQSNVLFLDGD